MNFLIIVYKGIGDVILTTPLIKAIKKYFPDSKIYFLTKKYSSEILKNNPYIDKVLLREEITIKELRSYKINVSIDYMLSSSSAFFSFMSGAKKRIAFWRSWGFIAYNLMIKSEYEGYNVIKKFQYLKPLGVNWKEINDIKPEIYPLTSDFLKAKEILISKGINIEKDKIATFDITSPRAYRQLSADKFISIADKIIEKGYKTIFHPALWEYNYVIESINKYSKYKDSHLVITNLNLLELSALISYSNLHIGTSSAPMHIAVSFNVPTFTIYSPYSDPQAWGPPLKIHSGIQGELEKMTVEEITHKLFSFLENI
ncbi:MAG: glycosyltransferase family 9 protein [Elusimicrobiota bacterium]